MAKTLKEITNHSLKLAKVFSKCPVPYKAYVSLCSNASQYSGSIRVVIKLKTKQFVKFTIYLNCKVFVETAVKLRNV